MGLEGKEFRAVVFNAARDNKLARLKIFLDEDRSKSWIDGCLNSTENDKIPLVVASRYGYIDIVQYLIRKGANPNIRGTVSFDGETINNAPALWAAAAAGHLNVVKFLVNEAKADVNQPTSTNSTPLRGACYDGHSEIVKFLIENGADMEIANQHGHTPLMIACFRGNTDVAAYLLSQGADLKKKSKKGNTALHDAAEGDRAEICKLLIDAGAELCEDDTGTCPLMSSAMLGNESTIAILLTICPALKKRDVYKVLGCTRCDKKMDMDGTIAAWNQALSIELNDEEREQVLRQRTDFEVPSVYGDMVEFQTPAEVRALVGFPDRIHMMSLIIRERVLGGAHPDVHYYIRFRGAVCCDLGRVEKCFQLWNHALKLQQKYLSPLNLSTMATFQAFQETIGLTINEQRIHLDLGRAPNSPIRTEQVTNLYERICDELERLSTWNRPLYEDCCGESHNHNAQEDKEKLVLIALQVILLVDRLALSLDGDGDNDLESAEKCSNAAFNATRLIKLCRNLDMKPLHLSLRESPERLESHQFPSIYVVKRLLESGADIAETDKDSNTPLHILLLNARPRESISSLLLENGAPLLARNSDDNTCLQLLYKANLHKIRPGRFISLQGLAANVLRRSENVIDDAKRRRCDFSNILPSDILGIYFTH